MRLSGLTCCSDGVLVSAFEIRIELVARRGPGVLRIFRAQTREAFGLAQGVFCGTAMLTLPGGGAGLAF